MNKSYTGRCFIMYYRNLRWRWRSSPSVNRVLPIMPLLSPAGAENRTDLVWYWRLPEVAKRPLASSSLVRFNWFSMVYGWIVMFARIVIYTTAMRLSSLSLFSQFSSMYCWIYKEKKKCFLPCFSWLFSHAFIYSGDNIHLHEIFWQSDERSG